jgi:hypothetical protein
MLALAAAALAVAAHGVGGGHVPDTALVALLTLVVARAGCALAARRRGGMPVLLILGMSQAAAHIVLGDVVAGHAAHHSVVPLWPMLFAHLVATIVTAALLTRADQAISCAGSAVAALLAAIHVPTAAPVAPVGHAAVPAVVFGHGQVIDVMLQRVCGRRGPPERS